MKWHELSTLFCCFLKLANVFSLVFGIEPNCPALGVPGHTSGKLGLFSFRIRISDEGKEKRERRGRNKGTSLLEGQRWPAKDNTSFCLIRFQEIERGGARVLEGGEGVREPWGLL